MREVRRSGKRLSNFAEWWSCLSWRQRHQLFHTKFDFANAFGVPKLIPVASAGSLHFSALSLIPSYLILFSPPTTSDFLLQLSRSKNRIRSSQTERSFRNSRSAMTIDALGESPRTPLPREGLRKRAAIEASCGFSSTNSSCLPPTLHRSHHISIEARKSSPSQGDLMDEDMSPSSLRKVFWDRRRWICGRCLDCSWRHGGVLVVGGFFVETESYAIASSHDEVTRWGLFLMRGVHILFGSVAYGKADAANLRSEAKL
jgi:hypothetical protein